MIQQFRQPYHHDELVARNYSRRSLSRVFPVCSRTKSHTRSYTRHRRVSRRGPRTRPTGGRAPRRKYASRIRVDSNFVGRRRHHAVHESISCQPRRGPASRSTRDFLATNDTSRSVGDDEREGERPETLREKCHGRNGLVNPSRLGFSALDSPLGTI